MLTLNSGLVIIPNQFYVIFHNTIPQKPVQHMSFRYFVNWAFACDVAQNTEAKLPPCWCSIQ